MKINKPETLTEIVPVRFRKSEVKIIDKRKGKNTRSDFIRLKTLQ